MRRFLVTGTREWANPILTEYALHLARVVMFDPNDETPLQLVGTTARGSCRTAVRIWESWGYPTELYNPNWRRLDEPGYSDSIVNYLLFMLKPQLVLAFNPEDEHSKETVRRANEWGLPIHIFKG